MNANRYLPPLASSSVKIHLLLLLLALGVLIPGLACSNSEPGWQRLCHDEWQWVQLGMHWQMGVPADSFRLSAEPGDRLRATLVNPGQKPALAGLTGPGAGYSWQVASGGTRQLDLGFEQGGTFTFRAGPELMLCSPRRGRPLAEPRLVVLIVVDTLRDDHVNRELMPGVIEAFAGGRRWRDTSAAATWTLPSLASLFTSRPVLDLSTPAGDLIGIPGGLESWPQTLADAGFSGAAVVANYSVHVANGFGLGFASYWVPSGRGSADHPDAARVVEHARSWLAAHRGEDSFLYLHFMDPHEPYRDHSGDQAAELPLLSELASGRQQPSAAVTALMQHRYAGEVRHVDQVLAPFLAELPASAIVALTADHGESLGEHGCWGHGPSLFQTEVAVPLLLRGPGVPPGEVAEPVQLLDLVPTLLALAGIEPGPDLLGRSLLHGGSELPIVSATFSSGPLIWAWRQGSNKVVLRMAEQPGLGSEARTRFIPGNPQAPGAYQYQLADDPQELQPQIPAGELLAGAGRAFVDTAGQMVPGLQLMVWGGPDLADGDGGIEVDVEIDGGFEVIQAWSSGPISFVHQDGIARIACAQAFPICAVAGTTGREILVRPLPGSLSWSIDTARQPLGNLKPPGNLVAGQAMIWWNPERRRVVGAFNETVEKLRALGYL
jgi:hypothetical protein